MNDEATTTYGAIIDQMTLGHQFILSNISAIPPSKGWQIGIFPTYLLSIDEITHQYFQIRLDPAVLHPHSIALQILMPCS